MSDKEWLQVVEHLVDRWFEEKAKVFKLELKIDQLKGNKHD